MIKKNTLAKKADMLPKYWSYHRKLLMDLLLKTTEYMEAINKGLPFFTANELDKLESQYSRFTWKDIDRELSKKGIIFKKATFRKYIQEKKIPPSMAYLMTKTGREAIYPSDIIRHINFIQFFYRIANTAAIKEILNIFSDETISAKEAIEEQLYFHRNLREGVLMYLRGASADGDDIINAIQTVLGHDKKFMSAVEKLVFQIGKGFDQKFNTLKKMLENYKISVSDFQ